MTIYDLLRALVDDSTISGKEGAHNLITALEGISAFGTIGSTISTEGASHVHVPERSWENEMCQRYILRCSLCRDILMGPWWPNEHPFYNGRQY